MQRCRNVNERPLRRLGTLALVAMALLFIPSVAEAQFALSTAPNQEFGFNAGTGTFHVRVVGETDLAGDLTIIGTNPTGQAQTVIDIQLHPSCKNTTSQSAPGAVCSDPDNGVNNGGVFALDTVAGGVGRAGSACAGLLFTITGPTASGAYDFTPAGPLVLNNQTCIIDFSFDVIDTPDFDTSAVVGAQTAQVARATGQIGAAVTSNGGGSSQTTVLGCEVSFEKQISCDGGTTFGDSCISNAGDIVVKWIATNEGTADATCTIGDDKVDVPADEAEFTLVGLGTIESVESLDAACDAATAGVNTGTLNCQCVGDGEPVVLAELTDTAEHGCCAIQIDKQVSCNGDPAVDVTGGDDTNGTAIETCIAVGGDGSIDINWIPASIGTSDNVVLQNCTLGESNPAVLDPPGPTSSVAVNGDFTGFPSFAGDCSSELLLEGETGGQNTATLNCDCALTAAGNDAGTVPVSAMDTAGFECQLTPGLEITKDCEVSDGTAGVAVTVTNTGDVQLIECEVTDALDDDDQCNGPYNTNVPLNSEGGVIPADFDLNASGIGGDSQDFTGSIALNVTTCNQATVTCTVAGTETPIEATTTDVCVVGDEGCLTHTIGFWSNRSAFVDAVGPVTVCGQPLDGFGEIDDLLCARGQDILHAQCAAAALNVRTSVIGEGTCAPSHTSNALGLLATCCGAPDGEETCSGDNIAGCIEEVSAFNESEDGLDCFSLGPNANFCNPGRNGPDSCNGTKGPKGPGDDKPGKGPKQK